MNRPLKFAAIATCDACLQYTEDCECCADCEGFVDDHEQGCADAETKPRVSMVVERRVPTLRGLGLDITIETPSVVFRIGSDTTGYESTENARMVRHG